MAEAEVQEYSARREAEEWQSPYELWKQSEGLPTLRGYSIKNVFEEELYPWKTRGGSGVFINLEGTGGFNDTFKNLEFVFDNPFVFKDRFDGEGNYFQESERESKRGPWKTNFVADVVESSYRRPYAANPGEGWNRAIGGFGTAFAMVNGT